MKTILKASFCFAFFLWSCSQKSTDEVANEKDTVSVSNQKGEIDSGNLEESETTDSNRKRVYKTELNGKTVFYVQENGKWGLEYEDSEELLPVEYDKIYSPNITAREYVEVEQGGKLGLFDYVRGIMIAPKYELIFPADGTKYIATGKIGTQFFGILSKNETEVLSSDDSPTYANLEAETLFDLKKSKVIPVFSMEEQEDEYASSGIVFLPSFVSNLGLMDSKLEAVSFDESAMGITQASTEIIRAETITDKLKILFTSFYEEGIDARDYTIEKTRATIINESNNVVDSKQLAESYANEQGALAFCGDNLLDYFMLTERLLEVQDVKNTQEDYPNYTAMTQFKYYKITDDGKLQKLESNRFYDCTKYASINSTHFRRCLYVFSQEDDAGMEDGNVWASDHLSIEDLDIMRNEIFADYGYKFKSEKWQKYFSKRKWYFPKHDNVDKFLTDLDKENIKTILKLKERMEKAGEQKFTNRRKAFLMVAG